MTLERLWAGWRTEYVTGAADAEGCVFCRILESEAADEDKYVLARDDLCIALLNAFPYNTGHLMVAPTRHVAELEDLTDAEAGRLWSTMVVAVRAVKTAYHPDGLNVGINLGRAAGAGVPGHFHVHCLPRWTGDSNFMTAVAETRVLPESLQATYSRLRAVWGG